MRLLMLDTSTIVASAAILDENKLIGEIIINHEKKHAEKLMISIDHLLKDTNIGINEIDIFGIVQGPGSFTGLRIGMATIKGLAQVCNKPIVGISTLAALTANIPYSDGIICPVLDAQRNCIYSGLYSYSRNNQLITICQDAEMTIDTLIRTLSEYKDQKIYLLGDAQKKYVEKLAESLPKLILVPSYLSMNRASSAAFLAMEKYQTGQIDTYLSIEPVYLRQSYAEE